MRYTILKQWKTLDGSYHSDTFEKANYDSAFGDIHAMVKPMINDTNVAYFRLAMLDEYGAEPIKPIVWTRSIEVEEPTEPIVE